MLGILPETQILLLRKLAANRNLTITETIALLSKQNNLPKSTLRTHVLKLRDLGLIECGESKSKGLPAKLTNSGKEIVQILNSAPAR